MTVKVWLRFSLDRFRPEAGKMKNIFINDYVIVFAGIFCKRTLFSRTFPAFFPAISRLVAASRFQEEKVQGRF